MCLQRRTHRTTRTADEGLQPCLREWLPQHPSNNHKGWDEDSYTSGHVPIVVLIRGYNLIGTVSHASPDHSSEPPGWAEGWTSADPAKESIDNHGYSGLPIGWY